MANIFLPLTLALLQGQKPPSPKSIAVELGEPVRGFEGWHRLLMGIVKSGQFFQTFRSSAAITSFSNAEGYIIIRPDQIGEIPTGTLTRFYYFMNL
jgi:molybdopterin biosynthesis enzyme